MTNSLKKNIPTSGYTLHENIKHIGEEGIEVEMGLNGGRDA